MNSAFAVGGRLLVDDALRQWGELKWSFEAEDEKSLLDESRRAAIDGFAAKFWN